MSKKKFTPMKVYTDTHAYRQAQDKAETKIKILNNAMVWCSEHINTDEIDREVFKDDFMAEFERLFIKKNKGIVNKELSIDKLMFLLDVNASPLVEFQNEYNRYEAVIEVAENGIDYTCRIDAKDYSLYTKNVEENERVISGNNLIHALELIGKYTKVYPVTVQQAVSGFLHYDMRDNKYRVRL